ncbi:MAG: cytidylyltransferase domain-containing protein [Rhodothalassiaceae bacterium]
MRHVVCIVQARRRSSRLPDKILKPLNGQPVLQHVLARCSRIPGIDQVVCAGVDDPYEAPVRDLAEALGVGVFAGSEADVLARYRHAADAAGASHVMRVTADCPLLDPVVAGDLIAAFFDSDADFAISRGFPHGLDCEIFTQDLLRRAHDAAEDALDREHVTLWMKRQTDMRRAELKPDPPPTHAERWVLDYPEDYRFLQALFDVLGPSGAQAGWRHIQAVLDDRPDLRAINAARAQDWRAANAEVHARRQ